MAAAPHPRHRRGMPATMVPNLALASVAGIVGGLGLLWRGLAAFRTADRVSDIAGSRVASLAVGEVRLTGVVEPAELLLTSPLQSRPCVWYRASATERAHDDERVLLREERAVGFRLRDETGSVRVFPRGGTFSADDRFAEATGLAGEQPPGLALRTGDALSAAAPDRDEQVRRLLAIPDVRRVATPIDRIRSATGARRYREARIEPGDTVTLVGFVEPFDQLPDPAAADQDEPVQLAAPVDEAMARDLAEARAAGLLATTPEEAWGNAAIPGFGIGRPVRPPELDAGARSLPTADEPFAERVERTFAIGADELVVAARPDVPLLIAAGSPAEAVDRHRARFAMGLAGALIAIASAVLLAGIVTGTLVP